MENMVNVYFFGKKYSVPADLTIMTAMEYAGYTLKRGCGCRHGFCGACATIYRIKGVNELKTCLACQTQVQEGMYVASIPFFPTDKQVLMTSTRSSPNQQIMMELYPEIYSCIGCNACTKACTQNLNVMQYIAYAQRGELEKCAEESFDCVMLRRAAPSDVPRASPTRMVGLLARRLTGKYIAPESKHLTKRVRRDPRGRIRRADRADHAEADRPRCRSSITTERSRNKEGIAMFTPEMLASVKKVEATTTGTPGHGTQTYDRRRKGCPSEGVPS